MTFSIRPIIERIVRTDLLAMTLNSESFLATRKRVVVLECGHKTWTTAAQRAACPRCTEMFRRSIETGDEDYDAFRNLGASDRMSWADDPCRLMNERTDLSGNLLGE